MVVERCYALALRLYPADYRLRFGAEMCAAFGAALDERRGAGSVALAHVVLLEAVALAVAAPREWAIKLGADPLSRARVLPDCRRMRPVGITRAEWASGLDDAD